MVYGSVNEKQLRTTGITIPSYNNTRTYPTISFLSANVHTLLLTIASINNLGSIFNNELNIAQQIADEIKSNTLVVRFDINKYITNNPEYNGIFKVIDFTLMIKF